MPRLSQEEFLERSSVHTLLHYTRNPNVDPIEFHAMEPGGSVFSYSIDRDTVLEELAKRQHIPNKKERAAAINKQRGKQKKKLKYGK